MSVKVCRVHRHIPGTGNLALILAAPDLLEACLALCEAVSASGELNVHTSDLTLLEVRDLAFSAITKAKGVSV
jgi:hypothetical protein